MDKIDRQIINCLLKNAQQPFSNIAESLGIGTDTVIRRYNALKKEGIIQRASITIDLKRCGFKQSVLFFIKLCPDTDAKEFFEKISHVQNVIVATHTMGDFDLLVQAICTDIEDFNSIVKTVQNLREIEYFDICIAPLQITNFPSYAYYSKAFDQTVTDNDHRAHETDSGTTT